MVSGSKLGLASSEDGWESTKVSGKSALWLLRGFGGKRPPHKVLGKPWFSERKRNQCHSRRLIQMRRRRRRRESHYKVSGLAEGPKDGRGECSAGYCGVVIGGAEGFAERSLRGGSSRWKGVLMTLGLVPPRWGTGWLS